ncbi:hypothetical protein Bca4012_013859 [Brassica carinata]|uniref:Uncharacterized protein n=1 Tax=Brassica carinata TaxID=52824 RepID=A0A8X7Q2M3_BRACI|nr:hypothetical protein Bca52824_068479 [Brassica carinata]
MMKKVFVQITVAFLLLAMIAMVSAQEHDDHDHHEGDGHDHASAPGTSSKKPNSAVFVAADMFTGLVAANVALVVGFIY